MTSRGFVSAAATAPAIEPAGGEVKWSRMLSQNIYYGVLIV